MTFSIGDRVMIQPGHPTFAPDWHGAYGHVESLSPFYGCADIFMVRIEGQAGEMSDYVRSNLGEVVGIIETALIHLD